MISNFGAILLLRSLGIDMHGQIYHAGKDFVFRLFGFKRGYKGIGSYSSSYVACSLKWFLTFYTNYQGRNLLYPRRPENSSCEQNQNLKIPWFLLAIKFKN
ncbi:hypothetical protein ACB092_05G051600 [Castanea dentata]